MPKLLKTITIKAPVERVFTFVDEPTNLPKIWPSLFEVKDVEKLPDGGYRYAWLYNMAGAHFRGTTEIFERILGKRIAEKAMGDVKGTYVWEFHGENGTTKVDFQAEYEVPTRFATKEDEAFLIRRNEFEVDTLLANLKAKLEV